MLRKFMAGMFGFDKARCDKPNTPAQCPKCGSAAVLGIAYGYIPRSNLPLKGYVLGGCVISDDDPDWFCNACEHQWVISAEK